MSGLWMKNLVFRHTLWIPFVMMFWNISMA